MALEPIKKEDININLNYTKEQLLFLEKYKNKLGISLPSCFEDADFLSKFMVAVKKEDIDNYVINTAKFLCGDKTANAKYILVFRRTTLGNNPKPEVFWTSDYGIVRNGLKKEIPMHSEHRILSKIFVSTLGVLNHYTQSEDERNTVNKKYGTGSSDGEIRISSSAFNLKQNCLFAVKPDNEQKELNDFLRLNEKNN